MHGLILETSICVRQNQPAVCVPCFFSYLLSSSTLLTILFSLLLLTHFYHIYLLTNPPLLLHSTVFLSIPYILYPPLFPSPLPTFLFFWKIFYLIFNKLAPIKGIVTASNPRSRLESYSLSPYLSRLLIY